VTNALLLDTHIALWLDSGDPHLRPGTAAAIDACWQKGGTIYLSAVSAWEIALLVDTGRIGLDLPVPAWIDRFLARPGIDPAPLTPRAAASSYRLQHFVHRDPGDRLLIATAIALACPLVTYDDRITAFGQAHGTQHGFAVAA